MSIALGQQALLDPAPTRTVSANPGCSYWGCDPGTLRVSIAWRHADETFPVGVATRSFSRLRGGERLAHIYAETRDLAYKLAQRGSPAGIPGIVVVEQPSGQTPNPELVYAVGAIQAAIFAALYSANGRAVLVETIPSATWKRLATGRGDAGSKKRGGKAEIVAWARENGYAGTLEDEADAWGVALAARRMVAFA